MKLKNITRPIYFSIALVLCLGLVLATTLTGDTIKAIKGAQDVSYPIYLDNNESVVGFQVEVNYSTSYLTLTEIEPTSRLPDATIVYNDNSPLVKIAILVNNESEEITSGDGAVLNLIFDVSESATQGDHLVNISDMVVSNISTTSIPTNAVNGIITILEPYNFTFLPPISTEENFTLQQGATLPLKFRTNNATDFVADDSVEVRIFNESRGIDKTYNASGEGDDFIRINETEENYIVNIHTNELEMTLGFYDIEITFDNFQKEEIGFELIQNGKGKGKKK